MSADEKVAAGISEQAARRAVQLESGGIDQLKEAIRDVKLGTALQQFFQDSRYAARMLCRNPGFSAVTILTFALGIGATTSIFSLFDAVLLRTLPVAEPQQLFLLNDINPREQGPALLSWPGFERLQKALPEGVQLVALSSPTRFNMRVNSGGLEPVTGQLVSGGYFTILGVRAATGRMLSESDNRNLSGSPVAVLSYSAWNKRFGSDPQIIGRTVKINDAAITIVGVAEAGFYGASLGESPDLWLPLMMQHDVRYLQNVASHNGDTTKPWPPQENLYWLHALARVPPPASEAATTAALNVAFRREQELGARQIGLPLDRKLALEPGAKGFTSFRSRLATPLTVLLGMVVLVLLIACANIANLLLARGAARQKEFAVRLSIGASRARLVRQLLTENLMLSLIGGSLGLLLVWWAMPVLPRLFSIPVVLQLDSKVLGFAAGVSLATGLLFGSFPALRGPQGDLNSGLKASGSGASGPMRQVLGKGLVISQIALSILLVTGAVLLGRTMLNLMQADLGFDREHIVTVLIDPQSAGIPQQQLPGLYDQLVERIESAPGVRRATIAMSSLAGGGAQTSGIYVPGYTAQASERPGTMENFIGPGYFAIMGMRLVDGRNFDKRDTAGTAPVAIINQAFARRYFAGRNPIGKKYGYGSSDPGVEIVGIVADAKTVNPRQPASPMAYRPLKQEMQYARSLEVRVDGDPRALASHLRRIVSETAPNLPVIEVATLAERVDRTLKQESLLARLTSVFAAVALLLACMGVYGLMSYRVSRRTAELGIRMALGARSMHIMQMVLGESLLLLGAGLAAGLALSMAGTKLIRNLLFGLSSNDPLTYASAALLMAAVAILSAFVPARRAARIDPTIALRHE
jgi:predicted permease